MGGLSQCKTDGSQPQRGTFNGALGFSCAAFPRRARVRARREALANGNPTGLEDGGTEWRLFFKSEILMGPSWDPKWSRHFLPINDWHSPSSEPIDRWTFKGKASALEASACPN